MSSCKIIKPLKHLMTRAIWTSCTFNMRIERRLIFMTFTTFPPHLPIRASFNFLWGYGIFTSPLLNNFRMSGSKIIFSRYSFSSRTVRTPLIPWSSFCYHSFIFMSLVTYPPYFFIRTWWYIINAQCSVFLIIPLLSYLREVFFKSQYPSPI